jgi:hypothetical protein
MAELKIPERYKGGLIKLLSLPDKSLEELISALERVRPKLFSEDLSVEIISKVQGVSPDDLIEIIETLFSLCFAGQHHETPPEELAEEVIAAMAESGIEGLPLSKENQKSFKHRLIRLFEVETLLIVAKALGVLQDNENTFCEARILTDMRPVFGSDPGTAPNAAVIVHILKFSYHHESELKDFYIALDTADIEALRKVLDRADLKAQSLKSVLEKAGITYLDAPSRGIT